MDLEVRTVRPWAAYSLLAIVSLFFALQLGWVIPQVWAMMTGGPLPAERLFPDETASDRVAATAAEFRVDESGAATYSVPLYGAPGTAGVQPKLTLEYSSSAGLGLMGKGWSIGGLSSIARCRATREAGDFVAHGQPSDGNPGPVALSPADRLCLDGQRLVAFSSGPACPMAGGLSGTSYRTEIESFQRICGYGDAGNGPQFFTVEGRDGSIAWYGDRDNSGTANRPDGYVNSTAPGKEQVALAWAQTRFQDSTGNYIDYLYLEGQGDQTGEHVLDRVRYTGKTVLPGQRGSPLAPYAEIVFNYSFNNGLVRYVAGGATRVDRRLESITSRVDSSYTGNYVPVRHYVLNYDWGTSHPVLKSLQECSDPSAQVCAGATTFTWSSPSSVNGPNFFETQEQVGSVPNGSLSKFEGLKFADIDADGRQDLLWFKDGSSGESCPTDILHVGFGRLNEYGQPYFAFGSPLWCAPAELEWGGSDATWFLFDYTGDGRDDLFVRGAAVWMGFAATGNVAAPFDYGTNLLAELPQPIPAGTHADGEPQHADINGDGLIDVVYPRGGGLVARIMERGGAYGFRWGGERNVTLLGDNDCSSDCITFKGLYRKDNYQQLNDFNADARSDLLINAGSNCPGGGGPGGPGPGDPGGPIVIQNVPNAVSASASTGSTSLTGACTAAAPFVIETVTDTAVIARHYGGASFYGATKLSFADINGDGLSDYLYLNNTGAAVGINTGTGFRGIGPEATWPPPPPIYSHDAAQVVDVNGDGRADLVSPTSSYGQFEARYGTPSGQLSTPRVLPNTWTGCDDRMCVPTRSYLFGDYDADGNVDFMRIKWDDGHSPTYFSRPALERRYVPRDVIVGVRNGLGAETEISYAPITLASVYRPGTNSRNALLWGRGSPVQDVLGPTYVVARAASSSPQPGNPNAKATVHYRYSGARMQAGGRGLLGFARIETIDSNHADGFIVTSTDYHQSFPYTGFPQRTLKRLVPGRYTPPACLSGAVSEACFASAGNALPDLGGQWFSDKVHAWEAPEYAAGGQQPIHVRTLGTSERLRDPYTGAITSRVETTFAYGDYGNVTSTTVDTFEGESTASQSTVITSNEYGDDPARWRLGRLTASTVTHRRPGRPDVVRTSSFAYDLGAAGTGLLREERVQPGGAAAADLRTVYSLDEFGNRTQVAKCGTQAGCGPAGFNAQPANLLEVNRYSRVAFDGRGRFPVATYEPFFLPQGVTDLPTQQVQGRDKFGNVTAAIDLNGVRTVAEAGGLGRPYATWTQTAPGQAAAGGGLYQLTTYRRCGDGSGEVACPAGAAVRQRVVTTGRPTQWTYSDVLGRPVMTVAQTFNQGVPGKDLVAKCTRYDASGRVVGVSNPFFLPGTGTSDLSQVAGDACAAAPHWTVTRFDPLGRPAAVRAPDNTESVRVYQGLVTTTHDAKGAKAIEVRNALGEVVRTVDAVDSVLVNEFDAAGRLIAVRRNAGYGDIVNEFGYDALGRKIWQRDPDAGERFFDYNALGELVSERDAAGARSVSWFDGRGRIWKSESINASGVVETASTFEFDTAPNGVGQLARQSASGQYGGRADMTRAFTQTHNYDQIGRPTTTSINVDDRMFGTQVEYNGLGEPYKVRDVTGRWSKTEYSDRGFIAAICESDADDRHWVCGNAYQRIQATDAFGNVVAEVRSPAAEIPVARAYSLTTGRLESLCAGANCALVDEAYGWDAVGNLHTQRKEGRYLEAFTYDRLDRLVESRLLMRDGITVDQPLQSFGFDGLGNVCRINGVEQRYGTGSGCAAVPVVSQAMSAQPLETTKPQASRPSGFSLLREVAQVQRALSLRQVEGQSSSTAPFAPLGLLVSQRRASVSQASDPRLQPGRPLPPVRPGIPTPPISPSPSPALPASGPMPHAILSSTSAAGQTTYAYDAHGNQIRKDAPGASNDRAVRYSLEDQAYEVMTGAGITTRYWYGPGGGRYKRTEGARTVYYLGNVEVIVEGGVTTFKRTVGGIVQQTISGATVQDDYLFHDRLGSVVRITDAAGTVRKSMDFAAFGSRREPGAPMVAGTGTAITPRGYTGHEHIDSAGVIHMNARLFDPATGRFLQPDPLVQDAANAQGWNAYSYVLNNPLRYTDPTGMLGQEERQWIATAFTIVATIFAPQGAGFWYSVFVGATAGGIATGSWRGALQGAFTAAAFYGIGEVFAGARDANAAAIGRGEALDLVGNTGLTGGQLAAKAFSHAMTGGIMSQMQGGKFGHGFISAGLAQASSPYIDMIQGPAIGRVAVAAIVGGTASKLTGGKFANGALTAAFSRAFNDEPHLRRARAQEAGDRLLGPYVALDPGAAGQAHDYAIGPTPLCNRGESGCGVGLNAVIASETVPLNFSYDGPGRYNLPYGTGVDPIIHYSPAKGIWINQTLEGHRYHDGRVVHGAYWSGDTYWVYTRGVGTGPNPRQNGNVGILLFGTSHQSIQRSVRWQILKNQVAK